MKNISISQKVLSGKCYIYGKHYNETNIQTAMNSVLQID